MGYQQVTMKVGPRAYTAVTEVRALLADQRLEAVTYNETLLELVRHWHATRDLIKPPLLELHMESVIERRPGK